MRNTKPSRFFTDKNNVQEQSTAAAENRLIELGNRIFWEFNPYKLIPVHLPHSYQLNRLTQPPIYLRAITDSPELQKHLANKILKLIDATSKKYQALEDDLKMTFEQIKEEIKVLTLNLLRQIDIDLSRPKGFQVVSGEWVRSILVQVFEWNHAVVNWIEETQHVNIKKVIPIRMTNAQKIEALKRVQPVDTHKSCPSSVSDAAKKLMIAVAQHEAEHSRGASPK